MNCEVCGLPGEKCHASCCKGESSLCPAHDHRAQEFLDSLGMDSGTFCEFDYAKIIKAVRVALVMPTIPPGFLLGSPDVEPCASCGGPGGKDHQETCPSRCEHVVCGADKGHCGDHIIAWWALLGL